jgi:hypothetical protein
MVILVLTILPQIFCRKLLCVVLCFLGKNESGNSAAMTKNCGEGKKGAISRHMRSYGKEIRFRKFLGRFSDCL